MASLLDRTGGKAKSPQRLPDRTLFSADRSFIEGLSKLRGNDIEDDPLRVCVFHAPLSHIRRRELCAVAIQHGLTQNIYRYVLRTSFRRGVPLDPRG